MTKFALAVAVFAASLAGCGGSKAAAPQNPATAEQPAPSPSSTPAPVKDPADYEERTLRVLDKFLAAVEAGGTDCDQLATGIEAFVAENEAEFKMLAAYSEANPGVEDDMAAKHPEVQEALGTKLVPALQACANHEGFRTAILPITGEKNDEEP